MKFSEKIERKDFLTGRMETLKSSLRKAIGMGLLTSASLLSLNSNAQENIDDNILNAIKNNEKNISIATSEHKFVSNDKPSFILTGKSELMDSYNKYNKNYHDSTYNKTNGLDNFSAGVVETLLLESSNSENFYIIQNNPNTIKLVLNQYKMEAGSGAFDSQTISKPIFEEGSHYYVVFSNEGNEYKAEIYDKANGLIDTVKINKSNDQNLLTSLDELSKVLGEKIDKLK
jgi:hypothetical protein